MSREKRPYTGCINNIENVREFARECFVYGLRHKSEHPIISGRTYDDATRKMGDWFRECLKTRTIEVRSKLKYLSLNCRDYSVNPLYKMWKARTFTTNEIVFFFFLLDYLSEKEETASLTEIILDYYGIHSSGFQRSAAQKWLKNKGCPSGIFLKDDKRRKYGLAPRFDLSEINELLFYFSEISPGGVIGSFILDKQDECVSPFGFKQHYIGQAFDSEIICNALLAIKNNLVLDISYLPKRKAGLYVSVFPLKVYSSTMNGRQYLIAWDKREERFFQYRLDRIKNIAISDEWVPNPERIREMFDEIKKHIWGVSLGEGKLVHVEFLVKVDGNEAYIIKRLEREKRCGTVVPVSNRPGFIRFEADVYDAREMFPWIRSFICRIVELNISDKNLEVLFWDTFNEMFNMYLSEDE